jgi:hypothetical protein
MKGSGNAALPDRQSEEDDIAGHVGGKNLPKPKVADGIHDSGGKRQADQKNLPSALGGVPSG